MACEFDYWYHGQAGNQPCQNYLNISDLAANTGQRLGPVPGVNGTYNTHLFADEAVRIIKEHPVDTPMYMYLAWMNVRWQPVFRTNERAAH